MERVSILTSDRSGGRLPGPSLISWASLSKLLSFSEPHFAHLPVGILMGLL